MVLASNPQARTTLRCPCFPEWYPWLERAGFSLGYPQKVEFVDGVYQVMKRMPIRRTKSLRLYREEKRSKAYRLIHHHRQ